jgi:hypothetical protein
LTRHVGPSLREEDHLMHTRTDQTGALVAAAGALGAGRAAARALVSPACDPLRREDFPDLDSLARRLSENGALSDAVARDVAALLSRYDALIGQEGPPSARSACRRRFAATT